MQKFDVKILNKIGMHLRAAGEFVKVASKFKSRITVICNGKKADGKSILSLASLAAVEGAIISLEIEGPDELEARIALERLIADNFNEN